jgi:hypothetical protein
VESGVREFFKAKRVAAIGDADPDGKGQKHARKVTHSVVGIAASVCLIEQLPGVSAKGDIVDYLAAGGTRESLLELISATPELTTTAAAALGNGVQEWVASLIKDGHGYIKGCLANAIAVLRNHPDWQGVLAYNEATLYVVTKKTCPFGKLAGENWTDTDDSLATEWMQHLGIPSSKGTVIDAIQAVAHDHSFHPIRDYFTSLIWDGTPRIERWLITIRAIANWRTNQHERYSTDDSDQVFNAAPGQPPCYGTRGCYRLH